MTQITNFFKSKIDRTTKMDNNTYCRIKDFYFNSLFRDWKIRFLQSVCSRFENLAAKHFLLSGVGMAGRVPILYPTQYLSDEVIRWHQYLGFLSSFYTIFMGFDLCLTISTNLSSLYHGFDGRLIEN